MIIIKENDERKKECREVIKLVNLIMKDGKKAKAEKIVSEVLQLLNKNKTKALQIFLQAVENVKPIAEVRSRRLGGAIYRIPVEINTTRRTSIALRWIKLAALSRRDKTVSVKISKELMDAANKRGLAFKRKEEVHKLVELNRTSSHFRA